MNTSISPSEKSNWFDRQAEQYEQSRFGAMTIMMTAQSCLGAIAVMFSLEVNNYFMMGLSAATTMGSNSAFISLAPAKWCLAIFYVSVITNLLLIFINLGMQ